MARKKQMDELIDHDFDGIQEYDNDMPSWWVKLFYITIAFAVVYMLWFHVLGLGTTQEVRYYQSVDPSYVPLPEHTEPTLLSLLAPQYHSPFYKAGRELTQSDLFEGEIGGGSVEEVIPVDTTATPKMDDETLARGKSLYDQYCFTCHGDQGQGGIGPNLTDEYWIHGGTFPEVLHTIQVGVPVKGMIAWRKELPPDDVLAVASFVQSIRGNSPPNPKDPEGQLYVSSE
jgi:cytochrome c oxidase cbb3-type subunit 3